MKFNIKENLEFRPLSEKVEILWISGPTYKNESMIADYLGITVEEVRAILKTIK